jgi:maleate isomerase
MGGERTESRDALGYRAKLGVIVPSTNTIVEPDYNLMAPPGVTIVADRMELFDGDIRDGAKMDAALEKMRGTMEHAARCLATAEIDFVILGMSAESFWWGRAGNEEITARLRAWTGVDAVTGSTGMLEGLRAIGADRVSLLTPYNELGDQKVVAFLEEAGVRVLGLHSFRCPTAVSIAHVTEAQVREGLRRCHRSEAQAILQVGTNLSAVKLAAAAERELGKPVLAINAAVLWAALRRLGIPDRRGDLGILFREH